MELIDYSMCGLAGLLVVLFIVGALAETRSKRLKTKPKKPPEGPFYILIRYVKDCLDKLLTRT